MEEVGWVKLFNQVFKLARPQVPAALKTLRQSSKKKVKPDSTQMLMQKVTPTKTLSILTDNLGQGPATQATQAQTNEAVTQSALSDPLHTQLTPLILN